MEDLQEGDIYWPVRENNRTGLHLAINGAPSEEFRVPTCIVVNGAESPSDESTVSAGLAINGAQFRVSPDFTINDVMSVSEELKVSANLAIDGAQSASEEIRVSAPIDIPTRETTRTGFNLDLDEEDEEKSNNGAKSKIIPPHVIIARRFADQMFSVCFGNGRTLRGRDLINFRNSIFRMTGFIE